MWKYRGAEISLKEISVLDLASQDSSSTMVHKHNCLQGTGGTWMRKLHPGKGTVAKWKVHVYLWVAATTQLWSVVTTLELGPELPDLLTLKEKKTMSDLFVKFLTFNIGPV